MKVKGVNLGNWLVLEKWMSPALFEGTTAEDEYYLPTQLSPEVYEARIKIHRSEYITERDFVTINRMGMESVRIPVPYFIFGDRKPFIGCIEELDKAFNWAEKYGLTILIDLHTVPLSQNGFDNGGISGVCKWAQEPEEIEFALSVLERLAKRYGNRKGLFGIQPLNEPITENMWETMDIQNRYAPADQEMAKGSAPITMKFLRQFYLDAYDRISAYMPKDKYVVIHDGFELMEWKDFMQEDTQAGMIYAFLEDYTGDRVCSKQLYTEALGNLNLPAEWETRAICEIMTAGIANGEIKGWIAHKAAKRYPKYGVQKGWERVTAAKVDADGFVELTDKEAQQMGFPF